MIYREPVENETKLEIWGRAQREAQIFGGKSPQIFGLAFIN